MIWATRIRGQLTALLACVFRAFGKDDRRQQEMTRRSQGVPIERRRGTTEDNERQHGMMMKDDRASVIGADRG